VTAARRRGLEQALDQMEAERADKAGAADAAAAAAGGLPDAAPSPRDVRRVMMRGRKAAAWRHLTLPERDALTVLTAICKVLGRGQARVTLGFGSQAGLRTGAPRLAVGLPGCPPGMRR
jgi:hypothetical protein